MNRDELAQSERRKYLDVWAHSEVYAKHSPGLRHAPEAFAWFTMNGCATLIDLGCGDGRAVEWFQAQPTCLNARGVDIAHEGPRILRQSLWDEIPANWHAHFGYSCDVLEHIPTDMVPDTIACMAGAIEKAAWFQIALFPDTVGTMGDWGTLHLTVKPMEWWRHALSRSFRVVYAIERHKRASFLLLPL